MGGSGNVCAPGTGHRGEGDRPTKMLTTRHQVRTGVNSVNTNTPSRQALS